MGRCGVYSYELWDAPPTASEVWQDIGNGGNISARIEEYPKRISGTSNPHAPVVPLVIGTTLGAHKEIRMGVNGLKPSTAYNAYCVANENPKILSRKFSFVTVNFNVPTNETKKTGQPGFIEQPKVESRGPDEVTFSATPKTSDKITCGIFSYSAGKPTADELYQNTGRNGAAKGTTNGPVVDVATYSTSGGPGTPIETSTVGGLSPNTPYRLYCATNDIPKVLSNEMLFNTVVKAPAVAAPSGASGAGESGASGAGESGEAAEAAKAKAKEEAIKEEDAKSKAEQATKREEALKKEEDDLKVRMEAREKKFEADRLAELLKRLKEEADKLAAKLEEQAEKTNTHKAEEAAKAANAKAKKEAIKEEDAKSKAEQATKREDALKKAEEDLKGKAKEEAHQKKTEADRLAELEKGLKEEADKLAAKLDEQAEKTNTQHAEEAAKAANAKAKKEAI